MSSVAEVADQIAERREEAAEVRAADTSSGAAIPAPEEVAGSDMSSPPVDAQSFYTENDRDLVTRMEVEHTQLQRDAAEHQQRFNATTMAELREKDPSEWSARIHEQRLSEQQFHQRHNELQNVAQTWKQDVLTRHEQLVLGEADKLFKVRPDIDVAAVRDFMIGELGQPAQQVDSIVDHRIFIAADDARQHRLQSNKQSVGEAMRRKGIPKSAFRGKTLSQPGAPHRSFGGDYVERNPGSLRAAAERLKQRRQANTPMPMAPSTDRAKFKATVRAINKGRRGLGDRKR